MICAATVLFPFWAETFSELVVRYDRKPNHLFTTKQLCRSVSFLFFTSVNTEMKLPQPSQARCASPPAEPYWVFSPSKTHAALPQCRTQATTGPSAPRAVFCAAAGCRPAATLIRLPGMISILLRSWWGWVWTTLQKICVQMLTSGTGNAALKGIIKHQA